MSRTIDQRVVEMQFDNSHFEKNVATSMSTLDKLKKKLNLTGASDGLSSLTRAANKVDFSAIGNAVDSIAPKFSFLYSFADQTFRNIVNAAERYAVQMGKAFTTDPVMTGLSEYETKINAIQVMKANTRGKNTMSDITAALDELNTYADKTIYNFSQMTSNVGKFVAQGLDVYEAANAVRGLANLAGASGASAEDMARATYQMSQALGGTIRKIDWNSLRNANMASVELKNTLMDLARVNGVSIDAMIKKHGTFEDTLEEGWLSGELFTKAMNIYSDVYSEAELAAMGFNDEQIANFKDLAKTAAEATTEVKTYSQLMDVLKETAQSGWTQSWELIMGDFDTAKAMFTDLQVYFGDIINGWSDARNAILKGWVELGGRTSMIESFKNVWSGLLSVITPIKVAFRRIFPSTTSEQLFEFTERVREITSHFELTSTQAKKLRLTFEGFFAAIDIGITYAKNLAAGFVDIIGNFSGLGDTILEGSASIGEWLIGLRDASKESNIFAEGVAKVSGFIGNAITDIKTFAGYLKDKFVTTGLDAVLNVLSGINDVIQSMFAGLSEVISGIGTAFGNAFRSGDIKAVMDIVNAGIFTTILIGIKDFSSKMSESIGNVTESLGGLLDVFKDAGEIPKTVTEVLIAAKDSLVAYQNELKAKTLLTIASAIAILSASVALIAMIDSKKLEDSLGAISVLFVDLMASLAVFGELPTAVKGIAKTVFAMVTISIAVSILASALQKVADIDPSRLFSSVLGVAGLSALIVEMAKALSKGTPNIIKGAGQMIIYAVAIGILAEACKQLSSLSWEELAKGLIGVTVLLYAVNQFLKKRYFSNNMISTATGMVILAAAIKILASACADFGSLDPAAALQGLAAIGLILAELALFTKATADTKTSLTTAVSLTILGAAMLIFASAVEKFGSIPWPTLALGLAGMAGALTLITVALQRMPKSLIATGTGLVIVAAGMIILAEALARMGAMSVTEVITGVAAMAGAMGILAPSLKAMNSTLAGSAALVVAAAALVVLGDTLIKLGGMSPSELITSVAALGSTMVLLATGLKAMTGTIAGSAALLVAAGALAVIAVSFSILSKISLTGLLISLVALAGTFAIFAAAGAVLAPIVPVLQGLGVAILLFGAGCMAAGVGIGLFGAGLMYLAEGGAQAVNMILTAVKGVVELLPTIATSVGEAIIAIIKTTADGAPLLGEALINLVKMAVDVLKTCALDIAEGVLEVVLRALELFTKYAPQILEYLATFLIHMIDGLATHIPRLIESAINLIGAFFKGIIDALSGIDMNTIVKAVLGVGLLTALMIALGAITSFIPSAMVGILGLGVAIAELAIVLAAVGALAQIPGLQWLIGEGGNLLEKIGTAIGQFIGGIVGGVAKGVTSALPDIGTDLSNFITNADAFISGVTKLDASSLEGAKNLAAVILALTAANLIDGIARFITGGTSLSDFGKELSEFGPYFKEYSDSVAGIDSGVVTESANAALALAELAKELPNSGGLAAWFAGDNSLASFGESLVPFGEGMKQYSDTISGLDAEVVTNSANAATALAELATNLPNSGGLASWFAGDNDLASFGSSLVSFGENFAKYAEYMNDVDSGILTSTTAAAQSIVELQKSLPEKGGWFSEDMSLADFGLDIALFGDRISTYYNKISGVDATQLSSVITQVNRLVTTVKSLKGVEAGTADGFTAALKTLGESGVTEFVNAFNGATERVTTAVVSFITNATNNIKNKASEFESLGIDLMTKLVNGVEGNGPALGDILSAVVQGALRILRDAKSEFEVVGQDFMTKLVSGFKSQPEKLSEAAGAVANSAATSIENNYYDDFYDAGKYLVQGFAAGITAETWRAEAAARDTADAAIKAAMKKLDERSPSRVFYEIGAYVAQGFALGIQGDSNKSTAAASDMAASAIDTVRSTIARVADVIDSAINTQPTIRPILDLSNVEAGTGKLQALFSRNQALSVSASMQREPDVSMPDGANAAKNGSTFQFTQINNSPKALSRDEIYRQTSNQFSAFERMVQA